MQNKVLKTLLILICTAIAGTMLYFNLTIEIPVFKSSIVSGVTITADMIETKRVAKNLVTDDFYKNGMEMIGKITTTDIAGEIPVAKVLTEEEVKPSVDTDSTKIAIVPIPVKAENIPADLKKGDLVNILASFDSSVIDGEDAFVIGYNYIATVSNISYGDDGKVNKVDCIVDKELAVDISASVSMGNIYIIKNEDINDIDLKGTTARDLLNKYYSNVIEEVEPETIEPEIVEEGE